MAAWRAWAGLPRRVDPRQAEWVPLRVDSVDEAEAGQRQAERLAALSRAVGRHSDAGCRAAAGGSAALTISPSAVPCQLGAFHMPHVILPAVHVVHFISAPPRPVPSIIDLIPSTHPTLGQSTGSWSFLAASASVARSRFIAI